MNKKFLLAAVVAATTMSQAWAAQEPQAYHAFELEGITVTEYRSTRASSLVTKYREELGKTPFTVSVINEKELRETGATSLADAIDYTAGVMNAVAAYPLYNYTRVRGFDVNHDRVTLNGAKVFSTSTNALDTGITLFSPEIYGMEEVAVVKGPSSTLNGSASAGGSIDLRMKKAGGTPGIRLEAQVGNANRRQLAMDLQGNISTKADFRLVALHRSQDLAVDGSRLSRFYIAPSWHWQVGDKTELDLFMSYQKDRLKGDDAPYRKRWRAFASQPDDAVYEVPAKKFFGLPGIDGVDATSRYLGYSLDHQVNEHWSYRQQAAYADTDTEIRHTEGVYIAPQKSFFRPHLESRYHSRSLSFDHSWQWQTAGRNWENRLTMGWDWRQEKVRMVSRQTMLPAWAVDDVLQHREIVGVLDGSTAWQPTRIQDSRLRETGWYVQEAHEHGKWNFLMGMRWAKHQHLTTESSSSSRTGEVGVVYRSGANWKPYANYRTSYLPNHGLTTKEGKQLPATTARQWEAGIRYESATRPVLWTLAWFDIKQKNVPYRVKPYIPVAFGSIGEQRSRGLELEGYMDIGKLALRSAYTFNVTRQTQVRNDFLGKYVDGVPKHSFAIWLDTETLQRQDAKWNAGIGVRVLGPRWTDTNAQRLGTDILVDASLRYRLGDGRLNLQVRNLFDREYATTVRNVSGIPTGYMGDGRQFFLTYEYRA